MADARRWGKWYNGVMKMKNLAVVLAALSGLVGSLSALAGEKAAVPSAAFAGADLKMEPCRVSVANPPSVRERVQVAARGFQVEIPVPGQVASWPDAERDVQDVKAIWIEGPRYKGRPTRFFAYWALPAGADATNRVPGIVLVHGGGGTAFPEWVKRWTARGYAAIAMDNCGGCPAGEGDGRPHPRHAWSGPDGWGRFDAENDPPEDQWPYQAVACVIRSHTFLRQLPEVDLSKIGVTGISWGGFLTSIVAGADPRFAFAVPVYGCGNLRTHSLWQGQIGERWEALWNPVKWTRRCRIPTLWCTGTNDPFFPLDSFSETARTANGKELFSIKIRMPHGHPPAGDPPEIAAFADSVVKGIALPEVASEEWVFSRSDNPAYAERPFETSAKKPEGAITCFRNRHTVNGLVFSTRPECCPTAGIRTPRIHPLVGGKQNLPR